MNAVLAGLDEVLRLQHDTFLGFAHRHITA